MRLSVALLSFIVSPSAWAAPSSMAEELEGVLTEAQRYAADKTKPKVFLHVTVYDNGKAVLDVDSNTFDHFACETRGESVVSISMWDAKSGNQMQLNLAAAKYVLGNLATDQGGYHHRYEMRAYY